MSTDPACRTPAIELPTRIQRKRTRGWKMPAGVVYVGRPTKWGNPWTPEKYWDAGYSGSTEVAIKHCVDAYRAWITGSDHWAHGIPLNPPPDLSELRGKDLACWCRPGSPCHADVLLEFANATVYPAPAAEPGAGLVAGPHLLTTRRRTDGRSSR